MVCVFNGHKVSTNSNAGLEGVEGLFVEFCRAERVSNVCVLVGERQSRVINPLLHLRIMYIHRADSEETANGNGCNCA